MVEDYAKVSCWFILQQSFDWMNESCLNNLNDVYKQYCQDAQPLEKHFRDVFVTGTVDDILQNFQVTSVLSLQQLPKVYFWDLPQRLLLGTCPSTILLLIIKYQKTK